MNRTFTKIVSNSTINTNKVDEDDNHDLNGERTEYYSGCCVETMFATNGASNGDWGHGGRTYISLSNFNSFSGKIKLTGMNGDDFTLDFEDLQKIEFLIGGEHETNILRDFFKKSYKSLNEAIKKEKGE